MQRATVPSRDTYWPSLISPCWPASICNVMAMEIGRGLRDCGIQKAAQCREIHWLPSPPQVPSENVAVGNSFLIGVRITVEYQSALLMASYP